MWRLTRACVRRTLTQARSPARGVGMYSWFRRSITVLVLLGLASCATPVVTTPPDTLDVTAIDIAADVSETTSSKPDPGRDKYTGSLKVQLEATGFFRVAQIADRWWLVTPDGHPFFSTGVNVLSFNGTAAKDGTEHYKNAVTAKFGTPQKWSDAALQNCQDWGINTVGGWSDWSLFKGRMPFTVLLDVGTAPDYFAPEFAQHAHDVLTPAATELKDEKFLVGYFLNNEVYWGYGIRGFHYVFDDYMALPMATAPGKQALIAYLQARYKTVAALTADFKTDAVDWPGVAAGTTLESLETPGAIATRAEWSGTVAEKFFSVTDKALRAADPHHMNMGVRFISQLAPKAVLKSAGKYVDVMSINFYELIPGLPEWLQSLEPDYVSVNDFLAEHYAAGGKPILITEWGYRAADSGLPNSFPPIYPTLATQADRADAYEAYVKNVTQRPYFVGHHWFLYADQPAEGRFDGEDSNFGLVTEKDEAYPLLTARLKKLAWKAYENLAW
jgi:hypothetical protein